MIDIFLSIFVITALALIFSHAWNLVSEAALMRYAKRDPITGEVRKPLNTSIAYAVSVTLLSVVVLWVIHKYTDIDLGAGHKRMHR